MGTVKIIEVRYLEADIYEGSVPMDDVTTTEYDELTAREAANLILREGLSFEATGNEWAANPDGSRCSNPATGERVETTAHLEGFHPRVLNAIMEVVR